MTTIAFRGGVLASDTQATTGHITDCTVTKIARNRHGDLAGGAGDAAFNGKFIAWFTGGEKGEAPERTSDNDGSDVGIIIRSTGEIECFEKPGRFSVKADYYAIGSGRSLALGAMACGASAEQAVKAAMKHDVYTGGEVTVLRHDAE